MSLNYETVGEKSVCGGGGGTCVCVWGGGFSPKMSEIGRLQTLAVTLTVGKAGKT